MRQWQMIWLCVGLVWWVSLSPAVASQRVFVSSTSSLGDLGGLEGADATCQQRADAASLGGIWTAWLSDEGVDAVDRLSGNGPFVLVGSNETIATNKAELVSGAIQNPINRSESGALTNGGVWTGTDSDGTKADSGNFCDGWTNATNAFFGQTGSASSTNAFWTNGNQVFCDVDAAPVRLFCFEQSAQRVFVSSTSSLGDLGGLEGADATCQQRADAASLGGIWTAWLSDEGVDAVDRLSGNGPFVLVGSNETIATNKAELVSGAIQNPINRSESGALTNGGVWTGTDSDGTKADSGNFCDGWTNATNAFFGQTGSASSTNAFWTNGNQVFCDVDAAPVRLFCFEQGPRIVPAMKPMARTLVGMLMLLLGIWVSAKHSGQATLFAKRRWCMNRGEDSLE